MRRPAMLASLASICEEQGVLRERALALHDSCADCNHCWKGDRLQHRCRRHDRPLPRGARTARSSGRGSAGTTPPGAFVSWDSISTTTGSGGLRCSKSSSSPQTRAPNSRREDARATSTSASSSRSTAAATRRCSPTRTLCASRRRSPPACAIGASGGVDQRRTLPWRAYDDSRGGVRYGGRSLGVPAARSGSGWSANVFADPSESMPGSAARR